MFSGELFSFLLSIPVLVSQPCGNSIPVFTDTELPTCLRTAYDLVSLSCPDTISGFIFQCTASLHSRVETDFVSKLIQKTDEMSGSDGEGREGLKAKKVGVTCDGLVTSYSRN